MIQYSFLGRTAASIRLNTTFRGLAPSPSSGKTAIRQIRTSQRGVGAQQSTARSPTVWALQNWSDSPCRGRYKNTGQTSCMLNHFCLRMGTELVPETLYSNELTRLCAREDCIESCRRKSFKTYNNMIHHLMISEVSKAKGCSLDKFWPPSLRDTHCRTACSVV
jgi:hypothetical protein